MMVPLPAMEGEECLSGVNPCHRVFSARQGLHERYSDSLPLHPGCNAI